MTSKKKNNNEKTTDIFDDDKYWEESADKAIKDLDKRIGWPSSDNGGGNGNGNGKKVDNTQEEDPRRKTYVQKYFIFNQLLEAIIIKKKPYFTVSEFPLNGDGGDGNSNVERITLVESYEVDESMVLAPLELTSYINKPYVFESADDFYRVLRQAKKETLDTLYRRVKSIWQKYNDEDDIHISICAADTIYTYLQDILGLTHYLFFVGDSDSGKTNKLTVFQQLAYRNFTSSAITSANIYQFLGSRDEGIGTICDDIDEDHNKMRIYKNGYITGRPITRIDTSAGRVQQKFNTFCFKAFAAERSPDSVRAKGFNQRIVKLQCTSGSPRYDISEVVNPAGAEEFIELLKELEETRNLLFCYRLIHYNDKIADIKLNIQNREKQLFKPVLRVFQNTDTFDDLLPVVSELVRQKRKIKADTLHAILYTHIVDLINVQQTRQLTNNMIWSTLKERLDAKEISNKPQSCDTAEFGVLSQREITHILQDVFNGEPYRNREGRGLIFDIHKLDRLGQTYNLDVKIEVIKEGVTHVTHVTHLGLDRHMSLASKSTENTENHVQIHEKDASDSSNKSDIHHREVSQVSQVSPNVEPTKNPLHQTFDIDKSLDEINSKCKPRDKALEKTGEYLRNLRESVEASSKNKEARK